MEYPADMLHILSGKVQGGKTTLLSEVVERLKKEDFRIIGFKSLGSFAKGERSGFTLENLDNGEQLPLASVEERKGWVKYKRFFFNPLALKQGEQWVRDGLSQHPDLVVIDEVGPMELEEKGWWNILKLLEKKSDLLQLWVVREQMLQEIKYRWNVREENIFQINTADSTKLQKSLSGKITKSKII